MKYTSFQLHKHVCCSMLFINEDLNASTYGRILDLKTTWMSPLLKAAIDILSVWYKTKFGSQILATNFGVFYVIYVIRGCREIWEALVLRTSNMASALVRDQMCTCPRSIKLIYANIICSSIGQVSSNSHLSDKAKIAFRTIGRPFRLPLVIFSKICSM